MKRLLLSAAVLALVPAMAAAQSRDTQSTTYYGPRAGSQEITLSGTGSNDRRFDNGNFGVTGSYGMFLTDSIEAAVRQSLNWGSVENADDSFNGSTRLALDYHFNAGGRLRPFIGVNVGAIYGDGVADTGVIGPEAGLKYFVNNTTFVLLQTEYQYFFEDSDDVGDNFDDGAFVHTVGLGFTF